MTSKTANLNLFRNCKLLRLSLCLSLFPPTVRCRGESPRETFYRSGWGWLHYARTMRDSHLNRRPGSYPGTGIGPPEGYDGNADSSPTFSRQPGPRSAIHPEVRRGRRRSVQNFRPNSNLLGNFSRRSVCKTAETPCEFLHLFTSLYFPLSRLIGELALSRFYPKKKNKSVLEEGRTGLGGGR